MSEGEIAYSWDLVYGTRDPALVDGLYAPPQECPWCDKRRSRSRAAYLREWRAKRKGGVS